MASILRKIAANSVFLISGQVVSRVFSFGYILVLARFLSTEDFGTYNLVLSFLVIGDSVADLGLSRLIIRDVARDPDKLRHYLSILVPMKLVLSVTAYTAILAAIYFAGYGSDVILLTAITALGLIFTGLAIAFDSGLQGLQKMSTSAACFVVLSISLFVFGLVAVLLSDGLIPVLIALVAANAMHAIALFAGILRSGYGFKIKARWREAWKIFMHALPYGGISLLTTLSLRAEIVVLGWFKLSTDLGYYSAAAKFSEAALFFPLMFGVALTPAMSRLHHHGSNELQKVYFWSVRMVLLAVIPVAMVVVVFSGLIFRVFFPPEYQSASFILQVLFAAFPLASLFAVNSSILFASDRQRSTCLLFVCVAVLQYGLNILLVRSMGLQGSLISLVSAQLFAVVLTSFFINRWFLNKASAFALSVLPPVLGAGVVAPILILLSGSMGYWVILPALFSFSMVAGALHFLIPLYTGKPDAAEASGSEYERVKEGTK